MHSLLALPACGVASALSFSSGVASAQVPERTSDVDFVANEAGLTVLKRPVSEEWVEGHPPADEDFSAICVAPCRAPLDDSRYQFGVRRPDGDVLSGSFVYEVSGPATFRAAVVSRAATRTEGWYVLGGIGGAGAISTTIGLSITCGEDRECAKWTSVAFWGGLGALSIGAIVGLPLVLADDELTISVVPAAPALAPAGRLELSPGDELFGAFRGLTVVGTL
jgi:hypothetical protein